MTQYERDQLVLSLLDYVTPLLKRYAARNRQLVSYDDLYQDAAIHILRLIDAGTPAQRLRSYAYNRVHSRIIDKLKYLRRRQAESIDVPIYSDEPESSLADLIPNPYSAEPPVILIAQERIAALLPEIMRLPQGRAALAQEIGATALASL
jgi:RNA polymerase sigma factor (sigma-70 family)